MTKDEYLAAFYAAYQRDDLAEADRIAHEMLPLVINELTEDELDWFGGTWRRVGMHLAAQANVAERRKNTA